MANPAPASSKPTRTPTQFPTTGVSAPTQKIPRTYDLTEPIQFLQLLRDLDITLVNLTAGSPYYNPHIQRPALFPPSDGYQPPEDPLVGVERQLRVTRELKQKFPELSSSPAPPTAISRISSPTSRKPPSAKAGSISPASAAWSSPIPQSFSTPPAATPSNTNSSAAPSATAPPPRATVFHPAATRSTPTTKIPQ